MSSMEKSVKYPDISIPGIISLFKEIDKYIIENRINYIDNENEVRKNSNYNMDDYFDKKNIYESNIVTKFKEQFIDKCIKSNHGKKNEILFDVENQINLIFKDYVFYYLSKPNYNYKNENIISFFEVLFKLFISENNTIPNNEKKLTLTNLAKFSLYIESYKEYIYLLSKFIYHMDYYIDGFLDALNKLINAEAFEIEDNDKNLKYVNNIFFNLFESAVCCILSIKNYRELSDDIFDALMKEIKLFQLNLERINNELLLMLKQIFYLNI